VSTAQLARLVTDAEKELDHDAGTVLRQIDARADVMWDAIRAKQPWRDAWLALDVALEALALHAERVGDPESDTVARRAQGLRDDLALLAEPPRDQVSWVDVERGGVWLRATPVDVAPDLWRALSAHDGAVVLASATLTVNGSFYYSRARVGLTGEDGTDHRELALASPFDFEEQAMLYLPRHLPLPADPGFDAAALGEIEQLLAITQGRAFVLFTSHRALQLAAAHLRRASTYPVLVQGDAPQPALVERFRATKGAVLLGTAAFWEGVDVPGDALSLVILEKLPFQAPDDPITAARARALEEEGRDPFRELMLPRAALALKQGFGRLIRRRDDRGIVAILDGRILGRGYGQTFLRSLPPARRTSSLEQVRRWW
jgi:ATP-dependent DNA helicase DinG